MKKIASENTNKLLLMMLLKTLAISVGTVMLYSFIFSEIVYHLDLSLDSAGGISLIVVALSAFTIAFLSCFKMKNSGILLGILSEIPLIFYTLINVIFHEASVLYFIIKLVIILCSGALAGFLAVRKTTRFKV